jgi:hypothetical protein
MSVQWQGIGPLEFRKVPFTVEDNGEGPRGLAIEMKGLIPVLSATRLAVVTSVLDVTNADEPQPVLSELDAFQENGTTAYQHFMEAGLAEPDQGFISWVRVGVVFPDLLYPPQGGRRKLAIIIRMIDTNNSGS